MSISQSIDQFVDLPAQTAYDDLNVFHVRADRSNVIRAW